MLHSFSVTDIGKRRQLNQDYVYTSETSVGNLPNVFVVADGMGGHNAGDYASKCAVETLVREIKGSFEKNPVRIIGKAIKVANDQVRRKAGEDIHLQGMGTTIVVATCLGHYLHVANVGDSRLYIIHDEVRQITRDHSLWKKWYEWVEWTKLLLGIIRTKILLQELWGQEIRWKWISSARNYIPVIWY